MNVAQLIAKKRDGEDLSESEIKFLVNGYAEEVIPDYQMSALAMAIVFRGMTADETTALTKSMLETGVVLNWPAEPGAKPKVDKHSTGGVGDKISIVLAPLIACCGVDVPMISGQGLGPTGGTLDKLESIKGFRTDLSSIEIQQVIQDVGCVITGASEEIAPADKRLYALRDVTGTVESIPLITASILSKKLSEGLDALVLDVKFGSGAFMKTYDRAKQLAESLVSVGNRLGTKTTAILTDMNQPLGVMCGNSNEILESTDVLKGGGPDDVRDLTIALSAELLVNTGLCEDAATATLTLNNAIASGAALEKFEEMVRAQGGDPTDIDPVAPKHSICSKRAGFISAIDTRQLGMAIIELGGGRKQIQDKINFSTGLGVQVRIGDQVAKAQPLADVHTHQVPGIVLQQMIADAFHISDEPVEKKPLICERIG